MTLSPYLVRNSCPPAGGRTGQLTGTASWTFAKKEVGGERFPQAIAHRGYKASHPENTMGAFRGAVACGAHALETDVHITKDEVVVLSHVSSATVPSSGNEGPG